MKPKREWIATMDDSHRVGRQGLRLDITAKAKAKWDETKMRREKRVSERERQTANRIFLFKWVSRVVYKWKHGEVINHKARKCLLVASARGGEGRREKMWGPETTKEEAIFVLISSLCTIHIDKIIAYTITVEWQRKRREKAKKRQKIEFYLNKADVILHSIPIRSLILPPQLWIFVQWIEPRRKLLDDSSYLFVYCAHSIGFCFDCLFTKDLMLVLASNRFTAGCKSMAHEEERKVLLHVMAESQSGGEKKVLKMRPVQSFCKLLSQDLLTFNLTRLLLMFPWYPLFDVWHGNGKKTRASSWRTLNAFGPSTRCRSKLQVESVIRFRLISLAKTTGAEINLFPLPLRLLSFLQSA